MRLSVAPLLYWRNCSPVGRFLYLSDIWMDSRSAGIAGASTWRFRRIPRRILRRWGSCVTISWLIPWATAVIICWAVFCVPAACRLIAFFVHKTSALVLSGAWLCWWVSFKMTSFNICNSALGWEELLPVPFASSFRFYQLLFTFLINCTTC